MATGAFPWPSFWRPVLVSICSVAKFCFVMKTLSSVIQMRNVSIVDAGAFTAAILLVSVAVALAAYVPARRATRINPSQALRADA